MSETRHTPRKGSFLTLGTFLFGIPFGLGTVQLLSSDFVPHDVSHYVQHEVEQVEVVMFCCGLMMLMLKFLGSGLERSACRSQLVPAWDGKPVPASQAGNLLGYLKQQPGRLLNTLLGRRIENILGFVENRGSADDLDDQMRSLSDNDHMALDSSYSLVRFITWAIPILGFLGTVLGITKAISSVDPETLDKNLGSVTGGLGLAFDATALGLSLTMVLMFITFLTEKIEQSVLQRVDETADVELAHRFQRGGADSSGMVMELHRHSDILLGTMEKLVEKQALVWARTIDHANKTWNETGLAQQRKLTEALEDALHTTLRSHGEKQKETEEKLLVRHQAMLTAITQLAGSLQKTSEAQQFAFQRTVDEQQRLLLKSAEEHQRALQQQQLALQKSASDQQLALHKSAEEHQRTLQQQQLALHKSAEEQAKSLQLLAHGIQSQAQALIGVQEGEANLIRLQESLNQNLSSLTNTGMFEQAVESLTAAVHLLSAKLQSGGMKKAA